MALATPAEIALWYRTCRACGRVVHNPMAEMHAYYHGNYCSEACYDTLFARCLFCGKQSMDAATHLHQHGKRLCQECFDAHQGIVLTDEQRYERSVTQLQYACWRPA